jgi:hypothetical protein
VQALTDELFLDWQKLLQPLGVESFTIQSTFAELVASLHAGQIRTFSP